MATSKELIKAQDNGAEIRVQNASGSKVEYAPRVKGDRSPWVYREGTAWYRYTAARCVAVTPKLEPVVDEAPAVLASNAQAAMDGVSKVRNLIATVRKSHPAAIDFEPSHDDQDGHVIGYTFRSGSTRWAGYGWVTLAGTVDSGLEDFRYQAAAMIPHAVQDELTRQRSAAQPHEFHKLSSEVRRSYPNAAEFEPSHDDVTGQLLGYTFRESPSTMSNYGWITLAGEYSRGLESYRSYAATTLAYAANWR